MTTVDDSPANVLADVLKAEKRTGPIIQVVGVGLSGAASLSPRVLALAESATLLIGSQRHVNAFEYLWQPQRIASAPRSPEPVESWLLGNFTQVFADLQARLAASPSTQAVILASGDPLFFGIGRLLLAAFPAEQLMFHPQVSSIQLAFSRLKLPWQDATLISVHGRGEQQLVKALKRGDRKIAVLTYVLLTPRAIAALMAALDLPIRYRLWVCENLGDDNERIHQLRYQPHQAQRQTFAPLNVVVLHRQSDEMALPSGAESASTKGGAIGHQVFPKADTLPLIGLPDAAFQSFPDRPTLMTKREVRLLILGALSPLDGQTIWDIGAGTGSISVELSRLCPTAKIYAIEKTAMGAALIRHNADRYAIAPIQVIQGKAPEALAELPKPDRVFIGGSNGQLKAMLDFLNCALSNDDALAIPCRVVLALATLEHLSQVTDWVKQPAIAARWQYQLTQINISRSLPVGPLTRLSPLNPVTLFTLEAANSA